MNKKNFLILLVLVVVLGLWGLARWRSQNSSWSGSGTSAGEKLLGEFDVNAVAQIAISQGTNTLLLAKKDEVWRVTQRNDYPANFAEISALLLKLKNLKTIQVEPIGAAQLPRMELAPGGSNAPTLVELREAGGKALKTLTLGKKHLQAAPGGGMDDLGGGGWPDGRYVQVGGVTDKVMLISDALTDVEPGAGRWLNKNFFKIEKPKFIAVSFAEATNSWVLTRESESAEWKLEAASAEEKLDAGKVSGVSNPFSSPSLNDVVLGLTPEQSGLDKPTVVKVTTFDGFDYTVKVGTKQDDDYLITLAVTGSFARERTAGAEEKPEDKAKLDKEFGDELKRRQDKLAAEVKFSDWTFRISSWLVDPLLKKRSELLETKPAPAEAGGATPSLAPN